MCGIMLRRSWRNNRVHCEIRARRGKGVAKFIGVGSGNVNGLGGKLTAEGPEEDRRQPERKRLEESDLIRALHFVFNAAG